MLQPRCDSCGAYVRDRVPALDLFATLWGMLESPGATLLRIGRSEQKNYTHLLFALVGPLLFASVLFASRIGDTTMPFGLALFGVVVGGPLAGLLLLPVAALWLRLLLRLLHGIRLRYRDAASVLAWSLTPMMWASVILLPLMLGVFGILLFSTNPPPWDVLPLPFWALGVLSALSVPWSMILLPLGFRVHGPSYLELFRTLLLFWLLPIVVLTAVALLLRVAV